MIKNKTNSPLCEISFRISPQYKKVNEIYKQFFLRGRKNERERAIKRQIDRGIERQKEKEREKEK